MKFKPIDPQPKKKIVCMLDERMNALFETRSLKVLLDHARCLVLVPDMVQAGVDLGGHPVVSGEAGVGVG